MDYSSIEISEYNISTDTSLLDDTYNITPEITRILQEMHPKIRRGSPAVIKKLKKYCRRYPNIPHFKNFLGAAYEKAGKREAMLQLNRQITEEHPEYLFGKLTYASILIQEGTSEKVPEILGEKMDLKALYPDRNLFHLREVLGFFKLCVDYYLAVDKREHAEPYLEIMKEIAPGEPETEEAKNRWMAYNLNSAARRMEEENERRKTVQPHSYDKSVQTTEEPAFTHHELEALYGNDMRIDHDIVREILELPRESLIDDLETVIEDSIRRFEYFRKHTEQYIYWKEEEFSFVMHSLFLLIELEAEASLPTVLRLLRQGEELLEFWFADTLVQAGLEAIYYLGKHQLGALQAFMKEPDNYTYARNAVSTGVTQLALYEPARRGEVVLWHQNLFVFFLDNEENERIIDTDLISLMVWDAIDLRATELTELIRELYAADLVEPGITGTVDDVLQDMNSGRYKPDKYKIYDDIYARYNHLSEMWYPGTEESLFNAAVQKSMGDRPTGNMKPVSLPSTKDVGRNDPCPCGSGRKYKYCCME